MDPPRAREGGHRWTGGSLGGKTAVDVDYGPASASLEHPFLQHNSHPVIQGVLGAPHYPQVEV